MDLHKAITDKGELTEFLQQVGWTDLIAPALETEKARWKAALVEAVLDSTTDTELPEVIAARIKAIDWLETFITRVISKGLTAEKQLQAQVFGVNSTKR